MLNRYNFASSSFEFSTLLSSRNAKKVACSPHFHLLHLVGLFCRTMCIKWSNILRANISREHSGNYHFHICKPAVYGTMIHAVCGCAPSAARSMHLTQSTQVVYVLVLWSTQRLSTFMSTQRISRHVDIIFNISTKEQWKNKMSIIT